MKQSIEGTKRPVKLPTNNVRQIVDEGKKGKYNSVPRRDNRGGMKGEGVSLDRLKVAYHEWRAVAEKQTGLEWYDSDELFAAFKMSQEKNISMADAIEIIAVKKEGDNGEQFKLRSVRKKSK